ncbi:unnamed protein product [Meloidogyne enterolobii]|uniref:Uncharacterized protein n=1 Tax=Meloidogyne enterolobii TaxID=390850 RepID=A0ACB1A249_MELEN
MEEYGMENMGEAWKLWKPGVAKLLNLWPDGGQWSVEGVWTAVLNMVGQWRNMGPGVLVVYMARLHGWWLVYMLGGSCWMIFKNSKFNKKSKKNKNASQKCECALSSPSLYSFSRFHLFCLFCLFFEKRLEWAECSGEWMDGSTAETMDGWTAKTNGWTSNNERCISYGC